MWKLLFFLFVSALSQYISKEGVQDALAEQKMLERIIPILDIYISDSLKHHKNSLLGFCAGKINDFEKQIETKMEQFLKGNTTPAPRVCDSGWISAPEKCYYVSSYSQKTGWSNAISRCTSMGAKLVEFQTDAEAAYLLVNMPSYVDAVDYIYTGRKLDNAGDWVFVSNNEMIDATERTWASGEPDNGIQKCGCTRQSESFLMYDCLCTGHNLFYICEVER